MSEKINFTNHEKGEQAESHVDKPEKIRPKVEHAETKNTHHEHQENLTKIKEKIEKASKSSEELTKTHHQAEDEDHKTTNLHIGAQLSKQGLKQSLKQIQHNLPTYQRPFSKFIHNNAVEKISDAAGSTVARPSGILVGGVFSFISSVGVLTICRYYGYEYNYWIGLVSFVGGFAVGLLLELLARLVKRS